tara:strand:+ start:1391 stop:1582 length:192 start_codon:yes stop_codon:yes gene_type:complete
MIRIIIAALFLASAAAAGGVALGPPPEPSTSENVPSEPLPTETIECIVAAIEAGLNPIEECDL